ncbi:hypothetical protein [Caulobacter sp. FWC26]|uniref:AbiTii domain-containing protein n=1 Tax=Caulobacter sp. FWC26 TaxID=69665 RepID=UPI000C1519E1|nr:hypothetical protein [Caulobacter sp. FWC26]AZS19181.1 hypothetical protein CSW63_00145 [Caulobacter sp. FWC26]
MASLVQQMQREALDQATPISQLLRKVKLAAFKLQLQEGVAWAEQELGGYTGPGQAYPDYRIIRGAPVAQNPVRGDYMPISAPPRVIESISLWPVTQSISSLEELTKGAGPLFFRYSPDLIARLNQQMSLPMNLPVMGLQVHRSVAFGVVDRVRDIVLDWAMALEANGVVGSELNFTTDEQKRAATMTINIGAMNGGNLNTGDITGTGARLNQGSQDSSTNTIAGESQLFAEIEDAVTGIKDAAAREQLIALTREMKASQGQPGFLSAYQRFVTAAADHMTVLTPFLPALAGLLGS